MSDAITVDVWSDVACPWCYIGKRNLEAGIERFSAVSGRPAVEVEYHSFELAPDTPLDFDGSEIDYLMRVKGIDRASAQAMLERVTRIAATPASTTTWRRSSTRGRSRPTSSSTSPRHAGSRPR